ncbi:MAG TPA: peptidylprolyl isomerase, partial [Sphingomicrobium sp.]|nr:peptidylprolyl isomerase [Sphingomicrobium sp.]
QQLTAQGFYDGLVFHRVIAGFMAQGGDPLGTGQGGSKLPDLPGEFNNLPHVRGVTSMARAEDLNSANSQFFIMLAPRFVLDRKYSGFGRVIEGMAAVDAIAVGEPPEQPTRIVRATIGGPLPAPPAVAAAAPAVATEAAPDAPATPTAAPATEAAPATDTAPIPAAGRAPPTPVEPTPETPPTPAAPAPETMPPPAGPAPETPPQEAPQP